MSFFKNTIHQRVYERVISVLVIVSVVLAGAPHSVDAETQKVTSSGLPLETEEPPDFPVSADREPARSMYMTLTAYSSEVAQTDSTPCITANGYDLCENFEEYGYRNTIATNILPFGTQVRFPELYGDKIFMVRDRMNARYSGKRRADIWMAVTEEARQFGVKTVKMEVF